ncbi:hypothetical protein ACI79J_22420 [Geodermatophilus sp. SYSU D01062]
MGWVVLTVLGLVLELALVVALARAVTRRDEERAALDGTRPPLAGSPDPARTPGG